MKFMLPNSLFLIFIFFIIVPLSKVQAAVPAPSIPTSPYLVGAFFMPAWDLGEYGEFPPSWLALENFPERKSLLGFYDDTNPEVMDWQIRWAREYGVNFFIFNWYRCANNQSLQPNCDAQLGKPVEVQNLRIQETLHRGFLKASLKDKMNFALMLTVHYPYSRLYKDNADLRDNLMPFLINNYFKLPNYLKIGGKPVLFIFSYKSLVDLSGSDAGAKEAISIIRQKSAEAGFPGIILMGEDRQFVVRSNTPATHMKTLGYDYQFSYFNPVYYVNGVAKKQTSGAETITGQNQSNEWLLENSPIDFILTGSSFWDNNALDSSSPETRLKYFTTPAEFRQILTNLKNVASRIPAGKLGKQMLLLDAWNEYVEGHYLAPVSAFGLGYLNSVRAILTNSDNSLSFPNPLAAGYGPYDTMYQNYVKNHERNYADVSVGKYAFQAKNEFIDVVNYGFPVQDAGKITFAMWIKPDSLTDNYIPLNMSQSLAIVLRANGGGHCVVATKNNAWYTTGTTASFPAGSIKPGVWNHLACVYNGTNVISYVNGVRKTITTSPISGTINKRIERLRLGYSLAAWNAASVARLRFVNLAYTDTNINTLYTQEKPYVDPATIPGDLTDTGDTAGDQVNIFDYNLLVSNFGNPYTIFEYNTLLSNFGM